jgi:predicted DNA-binding transcriptional regulator AlpA
MMSPSSDRVLTIQEVADRLGMSVSDVLQHIRDTTLWSTEMPAGSRGVRESEIELFLAGEPPPEER